MSFAAEFFDGLVKPRAFDLVGGLTVGHDQILKIREVSVETGVFDGWSQVGDEFGVGAALGD